MNKCNHLETFSTLKFAVRCFTMVIHSCGRPVPVRIPVQCRELRPSLSLVLLSEVLYSLDFRCTIRASENMDVFLINLLQVTSFLVKIV